ncbi:MAG: hypothetical protein IT436_04920 [Phycisphaerales bacterium]|nr:hypothetical protein [Phycisphaerales bacterium]
MDRVLQGIAPILRLTRVTAAFAAVANVWFTVLWSRAESHEPGGQFLRIQPLVLLLAGATATAVGLLALGMCLNDLLDRRRDRVLRPDRPIASGLVSPEAAANLAAATLALAVFGSTVFGTRGVVWTLAIAAGIVFFNAAAKFIPALGFLLFGAITTAHMFLPNPDLRFTWPQWLVLTQTIVVAAIVHVVGRRTPRVSGRAWGVVLAGWAVMSAVVLARMSPSETAGGWFWPGWVGYRAALYPAIVTVVFMLFAWRKLTINGPGPRTADKLGRYAGLLVSLNGCAWLLGAGHRDEAVIMAGLAFTGLLGMLVLRELYGLMEQPIGYRQ